MAVVSKTPFAWVVDIVGVVATFLPRKQLVLRLRLVCSRWGIAVADVLYVLKCVKGIQDEPLARIVAAFPELRSLDLSVCDLLAADAFRSLRSLAGLATLVLRWANVTDSVLREVSQIATLTSLNVACNKFSIEGVQSLLQLPRLEILDVSCAGEQLDVAAYSVVAQLPALRWLNLSEDSLLEEESTVTDEVLASVCNAARLTTLILRGCGKLTTTGATHLARLTAMQTLLLPYQTNNSWLAVVGRLTTLTSLDSSCADNVTDFGIEQLSALVGLTELDLGGCQSLTDRALATVRRFVRLETVDLSECHYVTDNGVAELRGLTALKDLRLSGCTLLSDEALAVVAQLASLETLELRWLAKISDQGLQNLATLEQLRSLDCSFCSLISDPGVAAIARLPRLETLYLSECILVSDSALEAFRGSKTLRVLHLNKCVLISNDGLAHLGEVRTLLTLSLRNTSLSDAGLKNLRGLPSLRILDCANCKLAPAEGVASLRAAIPGLKVVL